MDNEHLSAYVTATQEMVSQMNNSLAQIHTAIRQVGEIEKSNLKLAAGAYDMSYLAVRVLAELHVDFRTMLIRFAQEPARNPVAQENRELLLGALAEMQRTSGERPSLKPVPPGIGN